MSIENVVAQYQGTAVRSDKFLADQECLRDPLRFRLHSILQADAIAPAIAKQLLEFRAIVRSRNDEDVSYAREHQRAERVIDHWLVVDGQQTLANVMRNRIEPGSRSARQNDPLIASAPVGDILRHETRPWRLPTPGPLLGSIVRSGFRSTVDNRPRSPHSPTAHARCTTGPRSEEHTSELQSQSNLVCRLLLEKKKKKKIKYYCKKKKKKKNKKKKQKKKK